MGPFAYLGKILVDAFSDKEDDEELVVCDQQPSTVKDSGEEDSLQKRIKRHRVDPCCELVITDSSFLQKVFPFVAADIKRSGKSMNQSVEYNDFGLKAWLEHKYTDLDKGHYTWNMCAVEVTSDKKFMKFCQKFLGLEKTSNSIEECISNYLLHISDVAQYMTGFDAWKKEKYGTTEVTESADDGPDSEPEHD